VLRKAAGFLNRTVGVGIGRQALILAFDAGLTVLLYQLAFLIRFEGRVPPYYEGVFQDTVATLVLLRLVLNFGLRVHRWSFRLSGFNEALRLSLATLTATIAFIATLYFLQRPSPPRSVILLEFFLTTTAMAAFRFSPRLASSWYLDQRRSRRRGKVATLIVGAGSAGDLLLRDLLRSDEHPYRVVGFVDDDPRKIGTLLGGRPVLGAIERLPEFIRRHAITHVLIAIPRLPAGRIRAILKLCSQRRVQLKTIPVSFAYLHDRITASMLHALSPDDLLTRDATSFDAAEIRAVVAGKRVLITGAGGSIGSEITRQVASSGAASLTLTDMNENALYLLYRDLTPRFPDVRISAEVVDIREEESVRRLITARVPQIVFHAAAHKHVPLMEDAPEEAVKNNVFGTLHAARAASEAGAEHFVLISTDKAVRPASVMGVSKRVAEMVVRALARESATRFTAVRFGNVLGSSGSVVPLFKEQIASGGPVTVTHPDCQRYFMTISEAVGLVILAGLGDYGELCVLDMGEPIRILDLANHMITMAGLRPGVDIRVEFTGLRKGEKLTEELLTEEEDRTRVVRNGVLGVQSPAPPAELWERLHELRITAHAGDRPAVLEALRRIVTSYAESEKPESPVALTRLGQAAIENTPTH
jgi:FlaA1/EpsC-like NDP-sugar epimerase